MSKNVTKKIIQGANSAKGIVEKGISAGKDALSSTLSTTSHITSNIGKEVSDSVSDILSSTSSGIESIVGTGKKAVEQTGKTISAFPGLNKVIGEGSTIAKKGTGVLEDLESNVEGFFDNVYVSTFLKVVLVIYAAYAAPRLSRSTAKLFDSTLVRVLIAALIVFLATKDATIAILVALGFILSLQTAHHYNVIDTSNSVSKGNSLSWLSDKSRGLAPTQRIGQTEMGHTTNFRSQPQQIEGFQGSTRTPGVMQKYAVGDKESLERAGSNQVPGANQLSTVKKVKNTYTTQGLAQARNSHDSTQQGVMGYIPRDVSSAGVEGDTTLGFAPF
jgi:hypothetical protein